MKKKANDVFIHFFIITYFVKKTRLLYLVVPHNFSVLRIMILQVLASIYIFLNIMQLEVNEH
jgi:hypothetical protein